MGWDGEMRGGRYPRTTMCGILKVTGRIRMR